MLIIAGLFISILLIRPVRNCTTAVIQRFSHKYQRLSGIEMQNGARKSIY